MADIESTDLPLPTAMADKTSPNVAVLADSTTLSDLLRDAFRATHKWLFGSEIGVIVTITPADEAEENFTQSDGLSLTYVCDNEGGVCFRSFDRYFRKFQEYSGDESGEIIIGEIYRVACLVPIPQFDDDSYPPEFCQGFANFVLLKEGRIPSSHYRGSPTAEHLWYGRKMPYFLDWLDKEYGEGTIVKLIAAFGAQYDQTVFETVVGESVLSLWERYCKSQAEGESDQAEGESDQAEGESDQGEGESDQGEGESENEELSVLRHDTFSDKPKPTGRLAKAAKALLAIFRACSVTRLRRRIVPSGFTTNILSRNRKRT